MKHQYFGDINDYRKYGLLRCIAAATGERIGVCWMLTADDGGRDGRKRDYLARHEEYRHYDEPLFRALSKVTSPSQQHVRFAERWNLIPNAAYYTVLLHDSSDRDRYFDGALTRFKECGIIFFDPDNGIEVKSVPYGRRKSSKFVYWRELKKCYENGHSMLIYQHYPRIGRDDYHLMMVKKLQAETGCSEVMTLSSSHVVFFFVVAEKQINYYNLIKEQIHKLWGGQIKCEMF